MLYDVNRTEFVLEIKKKINEKELLESYALKRVNSRLLAAVVLIYGRVEVRL